MGVKVSGQLLAAGRVLAGLSVRELAAASQVDKATLTRLEQSDVVEVAPGKGRRAGMVSGRVFGAIAAALEAQGVEVVPAGKEYGEGVRRISKDNSKPPSAWTRGNPSGSA